MLRACTALLPGPWGEVVRPQHTYVHRKYPVGYGTAELLNDIVDDSDPDLDLPQIWHLLQTAESCRDMHPEHDWLHLTGFIHGACRARRMLRLRSQWNRRVLTWD
jgi:hypothetical protein